MSKKDVLIFLNIYLIMLKGRIKKVNLEIFKRDIIGLLSDCICFSEFLQELTRYRISYDHCKLGFYFDKFLRNVLSDIDKIS